MNGTAAGATDTPSSQDHARGRRRQVVGLLALVAIPFVVVGAGLFLFVRGACACGAPSVPPSPVEGVVTSVDAESIGQVRAFSLRSASGTSWLFRVGVLENPTEFPPGHLAEHQASSQPIRVYFRMDDGDAVAYRLEDANP